LNKSAALSRAGYEGYEGTKPAKPRKLSFKEARELEGMEAQIHAVDAEIARIEGLFASPDFHRTHATQTNQLTADLAAAKENLAKALRALGRVGGNQGRGGTAAWAQGRCEAVVSPALLAEYHETIEELRLDYPRREPVEWVDALTESAELIFPTERATGATPDPGDEMVLECALAAEADYIVSGDKNICYKVAPGIPRHPD
jgi:hypothetical protein